MQVLMAMKWILNLAMVSNLKFKVFNPFKEPDGFPNQFNTTISGAQIAEDYQTLKNLLNSNNLYKNSIIMGPSVSNIGKILGHTILVE